MRAAFGTLRQYEHHVLDTTDLGIEQMAAEFARRRATGAFALDLARVLEGCRPSP
jgi:hypothetical protein